MWRDLSAGAAKNRFMANSEPWKYDPAEAFLRIKKALLVRRQIDADQHGQGQVAAAALGIGQSTWSMWKVKRGAPMRHLAEIALCLDVDFYYLLGTTDEMGHFGHGTIRELQNDVSGQLGEIRSEMSQFNARITNLERAI